MSDYVAEVREMWLSLARALKSYNANIEDWLEDAKAADLAIAMAERAEVCFLRAQRAAEAEEGAK